MKTFFLILSKPVVIHILRELEVHGGESYSSHLVTDEFKYPWVIKHLAILVSYGIVKKETYSTEITYKLNHVELERINSTIARLL